MAYLKKSKRRNTEQAKREDPPGLYSVSNRECLGCKCFTPGEYESRGAIGAAGSRNTGNIQRCCIKREYHGCPDEEDKGYSKEIEAERKKAGWSNG